MTRKLEIAHSYDDEQMWDRIESDGHWEARRSKSFGALSVLAVASEVFPVVKTGGLADVIGSLPRALVPLGVNTRTLIPAYPMALANCGARKMVGQMSVLGEDVTLWASHRHELELLLVDCPALFDRAGGLYLDEQGRDYPDNWRRFALLSAAGARIAAEGVDGWRPDMVHLHDWQAGLTAAYMRAAGTCVPTVTTIHNLAFQGQFPADVFPGLDLPDHFLNVDGLEYYGDISYLKAGIRWSDAVTTVSPTYAREILTEQMGMGMAGVLQSRRSALCGIVNGIDEDVWNPRTDPYIAENYDLHSLGHRQANRQAVEKVFGLTPGDGAILSVISRLTWQKGVDLLAPVVRGIVDRGARLIVMGEGDSSIVQGLLEQESQYSGRVVVKMGFSEELAHLLHAGSDIVIQPSRFEPCGLTQLYALRYGAIPIVSRTGGLAETVIDANEAATAAGVATGFHFHPGSIEDLYQAIDRALVAFDDARTWRQLQTQAMRTSFGWARSAERYAYLYRKWARGEARAVLARNMTWASPPLHPGSDGERPGRAERLVAGAPAAAYCWIE
ncbi:glycogen synthase GlgA [Pleomorphomonas sp. JP5]|uniref:glycogen synthase GlgA n=1 Tax=Pleomorphomonas sp. JP5 TaxID=2942998 RepID=UPI002044834B|nr:glycogen synthase GlgA [Pleomorphomonas sp. JP5]MCM5560104.1 glycogen synthase GlgA [Pleomorphomonas sp. JP5]